MNQRLNCIFYILSMTSFTSIGTTPCAHFHFPTLKDFVLTEKENTTLRLPFSVMQDRQDCFANARFSLQVTKVVSHSSVQCTLMHSNGKCEESVRMPACVCPNETGVYHLNYKLDKQDNPPVSWLWSTDNGIIQESSITFNVIYPPRVTTLSILSDGRDQCSLPCVVSDQSSIEVMCTWDPGNPPVAARLLDRHGAEMEGNITSDGPLRQIRYRFAAVGCQDAGLIRCQAPGASQNKTATLLVKCPPVLHGDWKLILEVETALLLVNATTHTTNVGQCSLTQMTKSADTSAEQNAKDRQENDAQAFWTCSRSLFVSGNLPDVTLTLRLESSFDLSGDWRLELSNDGGAAHLDFQFEHTGRPVSPHPAMTASRKSTSELLTTRKTPATTGHTASLEIITSSSTLTYIATVIAVIIIVTVITINITVCCVKRDNRRHTPPARMMMQDLAEEAFHWPDLPGVSSRSSTESAQSSNTYEEIPDGPESVNPVGPPRPNRRTRHCQAPRDVPNDYLHPVQLQPEVPLEQDVPQSAQQSVTTPNPQPPGYQQPLYQNCSSNPLNKI